MASDVQISKPNIRLKLKGPRKMKFEHVCEKRERESRTRDFSYSHSNCATLGAEKSSFKWNEDQSNRRQSLTFIVLIREFTWNPFIFSHGRKIFLFTFFVISLSMSFFLLGLVLVFFVSNQQWHFLVHRSKCYGSVFCFHSFKFQRHFEMASIRLHWIQRRMFSICWRGHFDWNQPAFTNDNCDIVMPVEY